LKSWKRVLLLCENLKNVWGAYSKTCHFKKRPRADLNRHRWIQSPEC
jgi:hypothetical protein